MDRLGVTPALLHLALTLCLLWHRASQSDTNQESDAETVTDIIADELRGPGRAR
jgi:hypothetical protein